MGLKIRLPVSAVAAITTALAITAPAWGVDVVTDPFYTYTGSTPLSSIPLGTVLNTRTVTYHVEGIPTPVTAQQLLYRTNNAQKQAVVNVTSVIQSPDSNGYAISYQSAYDSLDPHDEPSQVIAGDVTLGGLLYSGESIPLAVLLLAGYNIIVPDTEGQNADFAAGPEYGMTTLDSIRAALNTPSTGLNPSSKVALIGYSGGGIATDWAAQLAPTYAPDVNQQLVGAAEGGVLVDPAHNINYVDGSLVWGGVAPLALAGLARAFNFDLTPYLSSAGVAMLNENQNASIIEFLPTHIGLVWQPLVLPQYASDLDGIPAYVEYANQVNAGLAGSPTIPMYISQGTAGFLDGTFSNLPGDGVMLAGDMRTLARQFCASGTLVQYNEYPLEHASTAAVWVLGMVPWIYDRFAGMPAPNNCSQILPGTSLAPEVLN